jgi:hypothetical protein
VADQTPQTPTPPTAQQGSAVNDVFWAKPTPQTHPPTVDNKDILVQAARSAGSVGRRPSLTNDLFDDTIVAKPLSMGEGFFSSRPKNPEVVFRAVTYSVTTRDGPSFLRYEQARSQGYTNATVLDCQVPPPPSFIKDNGQRIVNGDLILMKISKADYRGALKYNQQQAIKATQRAGAVESGNREIVKAMQETNMPSRLARKLQPFSPDSRELKKDFGEM